MNEDEAIEILREAGWTVKEDYGWGILQGRTLATVTRMWDVPDETYADCHRYRMLRISKGWERVADE